MVQAITIGNERIKQYDFTLAYQAYAHALGDMIYFAEVPWDTDLFGMPVYELRCPASTSDGAHASLASWLASLGQCCLVAVRIPTDAIALAAMLATHGFYPIETTMDVAAPLARIKPILPIKSTSTFRRATVDDSDCLGAIAATAFTADRFHLDPHLSSSLADERYRLWVLRALVTEEIVYAYENKHGEIIGFYHLKEEAGKAFHMHLSAIAREHQGSGAGVLMAQDMMLDYQARGYTQVSSCISLNNLPIYNVFARFGFLLQRAVTTFHWVPRTVRRAHGDSL